MTLISFTLPSDDTVKNCLLEQTVFVSFVGEGSVHQSLSETTYTRIVKLKIETEQEILKKIIYKKEGASWVCKKIENVSA